MDSIQEAKDWVESNGLNYRVPESKGPYKNALFISLGKQTVIDGIISLPPTKILIKKGRLWSIFHSQNDIDSRNTLVEALIKIKAQLTLPTNKSIVVLISGNGSNLQALIDAQSQGLFNGEIKAVISNKPDAFGLQRAENSNIDAICIDHTNFSSKFKFESQLIDTINLYQPDLIILSGFMRILSSDLVQEYLGKIVNIHPSLLPKYKGLHTHRQVLENGDTEHGTSVHFVTAELDGGPIIAQRTIDVEVNDTEQTLVERIQQQEHQLFPEVVAWFCADRLKFQIDSSNQSERTARAILDGKIL